MYFLEVYVYGSKVVIIKENTDLEGRVVLVLEKQVQEVVEEGRLDKWVVQGVFRIEVEGTTLSKPRKSWG